MPRSKPITPSRTLLAGLALAVGAYVLSPSLENIRTVQGVHRNILGNGFRAICPNPGSQIYRLVYMPKGGYTLGTWARMTWRGSDPNQRDLAFSISPAPPIDEAQKTQLVFGSTETFRDIGFQVAPSDHSVVVSMNSHGNHFVLSGFQVNDSDFTTFLTVRQVQQNLGAVADIIHHCSAAHDHT